MFNLNQKPIKFFKIKLATAFKGQQRTFTV
jgi:hypothetical protein